MKLSKAEEQLMNIIWVKKSAFMKDLMDTYPENRPAATTVATILKRLTEKQAIGYKQFGNSREYYPLITKTAYFAQKMQYMIKHFFNGSPVQFASFFTRETGLSSEELLELRKIIDHQLKENSR